MIQSEIELMMNEITRQIGSANLKLQTIQETHTRLIEFIFQTLSSVKSQETNEERLTTLSNGIQEIKKYSDQEIQKHTHSLGVLTGKLQGLQAAYETVVSIKTDNGQEDSADEVDDVEIVSAEVSDDE